MAQNSFNLKECYNDMTNPIVVLQYKALETLPPVMSLLLILKHLNRHVIFIGTYSQAGDTFLKEHHIETHYIPYHPELYHNDTLLTKITHRIQRGFKFFPRRKWLIHKLLNLQKTHPKLTLWFSEIQSAALLGNKLFDYPLRIVTIFELADFYGKNWFHFSIHRFLQQSTIVVPEKNRAIILQQYWALKNRPYVLPNKPFEHPQKRYLPLPTEAENVFKQIGKRPLFLYQGVWTEDRSSVATIIKTICQNRPDYCVLSMPGGRAVENMKAKYSNLFSLPYIPPPYHLNITSHATIGIAIYNASGRDLLTRLNALYCAPNKIYEYAGFGIPTLGNDVPGLQETIGNNGAGQCCTLNTTDILTAIDNLVAHREAYQRNSLKFYNSIDLTMIVRNILSQAERMEK